MEPAPTFHSRRPQYRTEDPNYRIFSSTLPNPPVSCRFSIGRPRRVTGSRNHPEGVGRSKGTGLAIRTTTSTSGTEGSARGSCASVPSSLSRPVTGSTVIPSSPASLSREGAGFRKDDNAFLAVSDPQALPAAADRLSPEIIRKRLGYWTWLVGPRMISWDDPSLQAPRILGEQRTPVKRESPY
jgi:hypothetical protein